MGETTREGGGGGLVCTDQDIWEFNSFGTDGHGFEIR